MFLKKTTDFLVNWRCVMSVIINRRDFIKQNGISVALLTLPSLTQNCFAAEKVKTFPSFSKVGDKFSFAIFADPQVGPIGHTGSRVYNNARRIQKQAIREVNSMNPVPAFSLILGDLVNVPNRESFDNIVDCTKEAKMPMIWTHGNHEARPPYKIFKEYQKKATGNDKVFFSWDIGKWHMIVLPCNLNKANDIEKETEKEMLDWLEKDLEQNKHKQTMVFEHLHLVPLGLSQLEWYTFRLELRMKLLDMLTKHGNVKWYFNGHVHNGIKAAVKMAKTYKGINFITCPTIIEGRNFGEEYMQYEHGLPTGGYYLVVNVDADDVSLDGKLVNVDKLHKFPTKLHKFTEEQEPRWFKKIVDFTPNEKLINGDFENGFDGWYKALRYIADEHPAFVWDISSMYKKSGTKCAYIQTKAKGREFWAKDDNTPLYQVVKAPADGRPVFKASYYLEQRPENAGGYIRISGISGNEFKFMMMFNVAENENRADYLPRCVGYEISGEQQNWAFLKTIAKKRQGMFWHVNSDPGQWHDLVVDISDIYDRCIGRMGSFDKIGITKYHISLGTWSNKKIGSKCGMYFDNISLSAGNMKVTSLESQRHLNISEQVFSTRFGQDLTDDVIRWDHEGKGNSVMNPTKS
jgi:hypothetical protein